MKKTITYEVGAETLQSILISSLNAEYHYTELLKHTQNPYVIEWLNSRIKNTSDFILDVQVRLEAMGLKPNAISPIQFKIHTFLSDLKALFRNFDDEYVISESLKIDALYLENLYAASKSAIVTHELYELYNHQISTIRKQPEQLMKLQDMILG